MVQNPHFYPPYQISPQSYQISPQQTHAPPVYPQFHIPALPEPSPIPHAHTHQQPPPPQQHQHPTPPQTSIQPLPKASPPRKRKAPGTASMADLSTLSPTGMMDPSGAGGPGDSILSQGEMGAPPPKKSRTNTPWSPAEEALLREKRDLGQTWGEIAKVSTLPQINHP